MRFRYAITRKPGENFAQGITTAHLGVPRYALMLEQHQAYVDALTSLGLEVIVLDALPDYPDAYFVEDVAVVTPEIAVITNPGAEARKGEAQAIEPALSRYRECAHVSPPGTLDGGDVLMVGRDFFIGLSERTNQAGAEQLGRILAGFGYTCTTVPVAAGLHLKSSVSDVGRGALLVSAEFADHPAFGAYRKVVVHASEAYAANTLLVNEHLLIPKGFPHTRRQLRALGLELVELDVSEARKMDGGLTCMSLRF